VLGENLPKGIENLAELEYLNLSNNQLSELPDLARLIHLKNLTLPTNQLTALPKSISKLTKLETLNLGYNQLKELPDGIFNSADLKYIHLNNNNLTSIPGNITKLKKLSGLNVSFNQLSELPNRLGELTSLHTFNFSVNEISTLPASIGQLKRLKFLGLEHNPLKNLPETLGDCDSLQNLTIHNCLLETLPNSIGKLEQLRYLSLTDQDNYYVRRRLLGPENIVQPAKYRNQLRTLPTSLGQCKKIQNLDLSRNVNWDKALLWSFIQLLRNPTINIRLNNCNLDSVPATGWKDTQIQTLELTSNQIRHLSPEWFTSKGIKSLSLMGNKLVPNTLNNYYSSLEERLLIAEDAGMEVPKPFPKTKEMAGAYLTQAGKKMNTDPLRFVEYMKQVQQIDSTVGKYTPELWGRFYFFTHHYRRSVDSLTAAVNRYFQTMKNVPDNQKQRVIIGAAPLLDFRGQAKWRLGDSLGAIKDHELLVEEYKLFAPNIWGRLGVWYKLYRPMAGKSGAAFDKAISMYENVRNQPPMTQLSAAEVYFMNDQADKAYEYLFGLDQSKYKPEEKLLAEYLLLVAQIAQKQAGEEEADSFEKRLKAEKIKIQGWSYQLFEESLAALEIAPDLKKLIHQLTTSMKTRSVVVD
jgi:Leucine-rich repeat (LRR) protein